MAHKKGAMAGASVVLNVEIDPTECPFREYKDAELSVDYWGMGPAHLRAALLTKFVPKYPPDYVWVDDQTQPLPRSVRQYLHGWIRAEDLAWNRWEAETVIFEESDNSAMSIMDMQLSHAQVFQRSSFCRRVLCMCFIMEKYEGLTVEHQWEHFTFSITEAWRARNHIYSPGMKPGGGQQHRPGLSRNGCYLVRLYYLGAWRCVWVSDQVPVDATDAPLLPFSPLLSQVAPKAGVKPAAPSMVTSSVVHLWPLLICKALLKLAAPDMNADENSIDFDDEEMSDFKIIHSLTGSLQVHYENFTIEELWDLIVSEVPVFNWDEDDETLASTVKTKSTKKPTNKDTAVIKRGSMAVIRIEDSKNVAPYALPGITPAHEMSLILTMARDIPLKKPLPEPGIIIRTVEDTVKVLNCVAGPDSMDCNTINEKFTPVTSDVAYWKYYRWVDWARSHGLYEAYDCPRTRFIKVNGLLKLSYAPHLLDVQSTESIRQGYREEHDKTGPAQKKPKEVNRSNTALVAQMQQKEELREWIPFNSIHPFMKRLDFIFFPSMFEFTSIASAPPLRITKVPLSRALDIIPSKSAPLYLQIDSSEDNNLKISLNMLHPRILINSGIPVADYVVPAHLVVERFEWFVDEEVASAKAFVTTRGYESAEVNFMPGRHFCRIWIYSRMNYHVALLSESTLLLGSRDQIMAAAARECPWVSKFLLNLSQSFSNWIRIQRSNANILVFDREFYCSYQPDLLWDPEVVGYDKHFIHWMFRRALQSLLYKRMPDVDFEATCGVLRYTFTDSIVRGPPMWITESKLNQINRRFLCDPDFGMPDKPPVTMSVRQIVAVDPCDCVKPEIEEAEEAIEEQLEDLEETTPEQKPLVAKEMMDQLLSPPTAPIVSQLCEFATEDLPCGILREEREKIVRKHEAATVIQAYWRGTWARRVLKRHVVVTPEVIRALMDNAFGNIESLSALMNEFFNMFPGAKYAYSVASALSGVYGLQQHTGVSHITPQCKWIPYFQGVFFCHAPVKVHFDVNSSLQFHKVSVYDNDTGCQMPNANGSMEILFNAHMTFEFSPNREGYTVMGHGALAEVSGINSDAHWQLTVLTCINDVFHICDNSDICKELPLPAATKLHVDEIFLPNRRNILGGIQISVQKQEAVSFRAASTSPDLEMVAILRTVVNGEMKEVSRCSGKGELYWPYIRLKPIINDNKRNSFTSHTNILQTLGSSRSMSGKSKQPKKSTAAPRVTESKNKVVKDGKPGVLEPKLYTIEVVCPYGWPLTLSQWKRVMEVRNVSPDILKVEAPKKAASKPTSAKEKVKEKEVKDPTTIPPLPDDAYVELECALVAGGGAMARRDDERDVQYALALRSWEFKENGRNARGSQIRNDFRTEFLEAVPVPKSESEYSIPEENFGEGFEEEIKKGIGDGVGQQGPTPATDSALLEMSVESEEETTYLCMPDQLKDKFIPLSFDETCTKELREEEAAILTTEMAEAAKAERHMHFDSAMERMHELQEYNQVHVLGRQRRRCSLLEKVFVDSQLPPDVLQVFEEREEAIAKETLVRALSLSKKKQDQKKK